VGAADTNCTRAGDIAAALMLLLPPSKKKKKKKKGLPVPSPSQPDPLSANPFASTSFYLLKDALCRLPSPSLSSRWWPLPIC